MILYSLLSLICLKRIHIICWGSLINCLKVYSWIICGNSHSLRNTPCVISVNCYILYQIPRKLLADQSLEAFLCSDCLRMLDIWENWELVSWRPLREMLLSRVIPRLWWGECFLTSLLAGRIMVKPVDLLSISTGDCYVLRARGSRRV
jgi:hypothetical protein